MRRVGLFCRAVVAYCWLPAAVLADIVVFFAAADDRDYTRDLMDVAFGLLHNALYLSE